AQRYEANRYPSATWPAAAAWIVDLERRKNFQSAGSHFESSYFLTFTWKLPDQANGRAQALFYDDPEGNNPQRETLRDIVHFQKTVAEIADIMRGVFSEFSDLDDEETLTYLHSTISTTRHRVRPPACPMYLDALLPDQAYTPGDIPMLGDSFLATCSI